MNMLDIRKMQVANTHVFSHLRDSYNAGTLECHMDVHSYVRTMGMIDLLLCNSGFFPSVVGLEHSNGAMNLIFNGWAVGGLFEVMNDAWVLNGLNMHTEFNGKFFSALPNRYQRMLKEVSFSIDLVHDANDNDSAALLAAVENMSV